MNGSHRIGYRPSSRRMFLRALTLVALAASSLAMSRVATAAPVSLPHRVDLRVLLLDDNSPWVDAIQSQMDVEGVPYTAVPLGSPTRPVISDASLSSGNEAFYQAVVGPDYLLTGLSPAEVTAVRSFEAKFGIREVDGYNWANPAIGLNFAAVSGDINIPNAAVTAAGRGGGFGYLNGPVPFSNGGYSYLAEPLAQALLPAGASYTTLVGAPLPNGATGSLVGVYLNAGVEQMMITSALNFYLPQFKYLAHGIVTWATRGVHFGYNRNNLTFHVDDAFSPVAIWDSTLNCTPGEDCLIGTDPVGVRMTPDDVAYAVAWQQANAYQLTLAFNGFYADAVADPLTQSLQANNGAFRWLNHGFEHIYQGCIQNFAVTPWACTTDASGTVWMSEQRILDEINNNIAVGRSLGLTFDGTEYLSGEHSGLFLLPQQPLDNPYFALALTHAGILHIGSDASRDNGSRQVGSAVTIPRHPTALYYNTATRAQAVDEYNWIYNTRANGGSGYCEDNPATATCLPAPLGPDGFVSYIVPTDAAFDMSFILSNDPRPFYAHTSNMTGDRLLYNLLDAILGTYRAAFTTATPLQNLTLTEASTQLDRQAQWAASSAAVSGYVRQGQVTITNNAGVSVPFTAPTGTVVNGATLQPYGGEVSAWLAPGSTTGTLPATASTITGEVFHVGESGALNVSATGIPTPTVTVAIVGSLPAGLVLTSTAGSLAITGTPASGTEGSYPYVITVISAAGYQTEHRVLKVTTPPQFVSSASATAVSGAPFSFTVTTVGSPIPTISQSGALPAGITFVPHVDGTATVAGTASDADAGKTFTLTLKANNGIDPQVTQTFTLVVTRAPQFTTAASATALSGIAFSFTVGTVGFPPASIAMTGSLPSGIKFTAHPDGTATLSGTAPMSAADHSFPVSFTATNAAGQATQAFDLAVDADYMSLISLTPARLADTRPVEATVDGLFAAQGVRLGGSTLELMVAGRGGVPADASAVALNVTVTEATSSGFVTVYPCGAEQPVASNLNFTPGGTVPNAVLAKIGDHGKVCVYVSSATHLVVDVNGYFPSTSSFHSMNPARVLDTRPGFSTIDGLQQSEGVRLPATTTPVQITNRVTVPADASTVVLNVTVTEALGAGYVTVYPCGTPVPTASNINYVAGSTVANLVVAKIGDGGSVCIYNSAGTQLIVDVNGYFPAVTSYSSLDPARLLDTRPGFKTIDGQFAGGGLVPAGTVTELAVTDRGGVPSGAATVVLNVTATEPAAAGYITAYPCGIGTPHASNLNYDVGATVAIAAIVQVNSDGKVCLFNFSATQLVVDVNGYLPG